MMLLILMMSWKRASRPLMIKTNLYHRIQGQKQNHFPREGQGQDLHPDQDLGHHLADPHTHPDHGVGLTLHPGHHHIALEADPDHDPDLTHIHPDPDHCHLVLEHAHHQSLCLSRVAVDHQASLIDGG